MGLVLCASLTLAFMYSPGCAGSSIEGARRAEWPVADPYGTVFRLDRTLVVYGAGEHTQRSVNFRLSKDAKQAAPGWYIVDALLRVEMSRSVSGRAVGEVDLGSDGRSAGIISFLPDTFGRQSGLWWVTNELFTGFGDGVVLGKSITLHFRNYLQIRGVRPGTNTLNLDLWQFRGNVIRSAQLPSGTRIGYGSLGPAALDVDTSVSDGKVRVGDTLTLHYRITNHGFPARDVGVVVGSSNPGMIQISSPSRFLGWISEKEGTAEFEALAPGRYRLMVRVEGATGTGGSGIGSAIRTVPIEVTAPDQTHALVSSQGNRSVAGLRVSEPL